MSEKETKNYDIVILGGGPAGLSAGIYSARGNLKTAIVDLSMLGGQPSNYLEIENYPGYPIAEGFELMEKFEQHADKFNVEKYIMQEIIKVELDSTPKVIETSEVILNAKTVLIATGAQARKLGVPGEKEFIGRGVSYCAVCDGAFFKEKEVCVVGGGNSAIEEAIYLTKFAAKVHVIHRRDALRAEKIVQQRAFDNEKIDFIFDTVVEEIKGAQKVESIVIKNILTGQTKEIKADGVFPYVGFAPNSEMFSEQLKLGKGGFIEVDFNLQTSIEGVYAAGDVRVTPLRQVITAAADGAVSATSAIRHLELVEEKIATK